MGTTTVTAMSSASSSSNNGVPRILQKRMGEPIKLGNSILEPAGTLVFQASTDITNGLNGGRNAVVANLFSIGPTPVLTVHSPVQIPRNSWCSAQNHLSSTSANNLGPLSSNQHPAASSATPDSGIQSIPTSPPSPNCDLLNEDDDDIAGRGKRDAEEDKEQDNGDSESEDFTDMPILKAVDEDDDDYDMPSTSSSTLQNDASKMKTSTVHSTTTPATPPLPTKDNLSSHMNAEELRTFIASNMEPEEIYRRLLSLDPDKANSVAMLIKNHSGPESKKKIDMESEVSSTTPSTPRARTARRRNNCIPRTTNSPDVTTSNLPVEPSTSPLKTSDEIKEGKVEGKKRGRKPKRKRLVREEDENHEDVDFKKRKIMVTSALKGSVSELNRPETSESVETTCPSRPESSAGQTVDPVQFRMKVREMVARQLDNFTDKMNGEMAELRLSHSTSSKVVPGKRKESFFRQLIEQSKKLKKLTGASTGKRMRMFGRDAEVLEELEVKPLDSKKELKEEGCSSKARGRIPSRRSHNEETTSDLATLDEKFNGDYYEIPRSVASSDEVIPLWKAPSLICDCTKGACTSDMECLNRALRVQCKSECALPYCSNRRFWREDAANKLCISTGPRSKRSLKTKLARRAGEFLCEYAGEVIAYEQARQRFTEDQGAKIIAIGSQLFVDATKRGNVARFVRHSCEPNSRLEVWSVNGFYRVGIFALFDLNTNVEITVDRNGLLPFDVPCNCSSSKCKKIIRGSRRATIASENEKDTIATRRFLQRNRRKTIEKSRNSGIPAILLLPDDPSSLVLKMKKMLAAFSFRVRKVDGSMPRHMLPYYSSIRTFLKVNSNNPNPAEFLSMFQTWVDAIDDDDLERAFVAIESYYMPPSVVSPVQVSKKQKDNAPRARAVSTSCVSPVPSKRNDADLSYLESEHPIGSYDPDAAWESYRANASDNAVRCICGALDEDGEMVQCDKCHFWLHIECCQYHIKEESGKNEKAKSKKNDNEESEYVCDFCMGTQTNLRPVADVKLLEQPELRFENCIYYRSLMNRRGIQVRLNETVYVNRGVSDDHKSMLRNLREEKKGTKHKELNKYSFPEAPTEPILTTRVERKDARIFRVERLFVCPGNNRFVFGSFYAYPHETIADTGRVFGKREVFATPFYETLPLDEVVGRCLVVDVPTWSKGRPKVPKFIENDVFHCEMQIKNKRVFEKVPPKNRYPINTQPYVFFKFSHPKKVVKDFRPYDPLNQSPKPPRNSVSSNPIPTGSPFAAQTYSSITDFDRKVNSKRNIDHVLDRLTSLNSKKA